MLVTNTVVNGTEGDFDLVDLSTVKAELGITDNDSDAILEPIITQCSKAIARYCRREFIEQNVTQTFFPDDFRPCLISKSNALVLSRKPIVSVTTLTLDDNDIASGNQRIISKEGMIFRLTDDGYVTAWNIAKLLEITYIGGYTSIPEDIQRAAILWIKEFFIGVEDDPRVKSENNYNVASFSYFAALGTMPQGVTGLLNSYREPIPQL